jgi:hypothetical protein
VPLSLATLSVASVFGDSARVRGDLWRGFQNGVVAPSPSELALASSSRNSLDTPRGTNWDRA